MNFNFDGKCWKIGMHIVATLLVDIYKVGVNLATYCEFE